jgi:hypothetical protein
MTEHQKAINREIYKALERLGAEPELLAIVGSYGDSLEDEDVLAMLKDWNEGRPILQKRFTEFHD